jgi:hypothetical protein
MSRANKDKRKAELKRTRSRRRFLQIAGAGAAMAAGLGVWRPWASKPLPDKWAFLERKVNHKLPGGTWKYAEDHYVPLCPELEFRDRDEGLRELIRMKMPFAVREAERRGWPNKIKVGLLGTWQYYGKPEEARFAEPYKDYLVECIKYLYSRLPQLTRVPLEPTVIQWGQDFSDVKKGRGFIGHSWHEVCRLHVDNNKAGEERKEFVVGLSINKRGSHAKEVFDENGKREAYLAAFGPGPMALGAAFSEIIPLAVSETGYRHWEKMGCKRGRLVSEAFSEGISEILISELIKELNIPKGTKIHKRVQKIMAKAPKYALVPASVAWLKKNGIARGLELYMEDPEKYLAAIQS